ncbi:Uncharacterised protein [Bordetella pertussis]|nr:Uncharacterised protein [Bordetella pertussis]
MVSSVSAATVASGCVLSCSLARKYAFRKRLTASGFLSRKARRATSTSGPGVTPYSL